MRPNTSSTTANQDHRGYFLRASISLVVIGIALAGSISSAIGQSFPPQPPPVGYPSPPPNPASPPPPYPGASPYRNSNDAPYFAAQPSPAQRPPDDVRSDRERPPTVLPQDQDSVIAALPPEYQPERGPAKELPPQFRRTVVDYPTGEPPGTIIIDTPNTYLYLTLGNGKAMRYGVGVGREGFTWSGSERISRMKEWPDWFPPKEMIGRQPYLPRFMAGGETNPLGARAMYLGNTEYRIHGTNQPSTIGTFVSSGCVRLTNEDVEDLYSRVSVGTRVVVLPNTATSQLPPRD